MLDELPRIGEPSRKPGGGGELAGILDPIQQRQVQEPVGFLGSYSDSATTSDTYQSIESGYARPYVLPDKPPDSRLLGAPSSPPIRGSVREEYPVELRPVSAHIKSYVTEPRGWGRIAPGPPTNGPVGGVLMSANGEGLSTDMGSVYNSSGDLGVGGLAFGTQAGMGLGFTMKNMSTGLSPEWTAMAEAQFGGGGGGGQNAYKGDKNLSPFGNDVIYISQPDKNVTQYFQDFTNKMYGQVTTRPSGGGGGGATATPYGGGGAGFGTFGATDFSNSGATTQPNGQPMGPILPAITVPPSPYLNLTGKHNLCPPATMADRYFYCNNRTGPCGEGAVNIMPIEGLDNHFYCTNPELPYRALNACPPGYKLVDNSSACVMDFSTGSIPMATAAAVVPTDMPTDIPTQMNITTQPMASYTTPGSFVSYTSGPSYAPNVIVTTPAGTTTPSYTTNVRGGSTSSTTRPNNTANQTTAPNQISSPTPTRRR